MRLLLLATALSAFSAAAQSGPTQQVSRYLDATRDALRSAGFEQAGAYTLASYGPGAEQNYTLPLVRGRTYVIAGACDNDCSDIDLWAYDGDAVAASSTASDDAPQLRLVPTRSGTFRVRVRMLTCSTAACTAGFGIFRR